MTVPLPDTADAVRTLNRTLDTRFREIAASTPANVLHRPGPDGEWTVAESLAHVAEFARYFEAEARAIIRGQDVAVGRTHDNRDRLDAVAGAVGRSSAELRDHLTSALDGLSDALETLEDRHLGVSTRNRKYGEEPFSSFLDRYVISHKAAHIRQLEAALEYVGEKGSADSAD